MAVAQVEKSEIRNMVQDIPIEKIDVHKLNPRVDVGDINGLAQSISAEGLYQPILVVRDNGGWSLIDGKRRLAAAKKLGLVTIPAIERVMTNSEIATAALVANMQRKDLDALEEARGYRAWLETTNGSQADLARLLGKDPSTISNALRLLDAPKPIADALREKRITPAHARVALELKDPGDATALSLKPGVTVDQLQESVARKNEEFAIKGEGARETLRKALADAKAKYPNATITWQAGPYDVVSLIATLGQPPAKIVGAVGQYSGVKTEAHDKACTCRAYELGVRRAYSGGPSKLVTELERTCIDRKGYAAAKPKAKKVTGSARKQKAPKAPKPPTPQQLKKIEAKQHQEAQREVAKVLEVPKPRTAAAAPLFKKLVVTSIPHEVARAIVITEMLLDGVRENSEMLLWQRIKEMPAKKISQLAGATVAHLIEQETSYSSRSTGIHREALIHFGVKVPAIKAEKKARR